MIDQAVEVFGALQTANRELGVTVLIVTHDPAVSSVVRRVVAIRDGRTSTEIHRGAAEGDDGEVVQHAVEYAVLDRAGEPPEVADPSDAASLRDIAPAIVGVTDIDPFVLNLAQGGVSGEPATALAAAILIAASSNNILKALYAASFAGGKATAGSAAALVALAVAGVAAAVATAMLEL